MKEAYYFPHYCNARHDRKIKRAVKELGIEGYGIFFMLLEVLRDQSDLRFPMKDVDLLADEFGTSEQKVRTIICNYGLFNIDDDQLFFSPKMLVFLQPHFAMKEQRKEAAMKSADKRRGKKISIEMDGRLNDRSTAVETAVQIETNDRLNGCSTKERKGKEKKGKEIKHTHSARVRDVREAKDADWDFEKLADYERVKEVYPKNGSCRNPEAEREFYTALKTDGAEAIISGAAKYYAYCAKKYGPNQMCGYIMQAKNFFKNRRYLDPWDELVAALSLDSFKSTTVNSIVFDGTNPNKYDNLDVEVVQNG